MFYEKVKESADFIAAKVSEFPDTAIILGSGLGGLVDFMEEKTSKFQLETINFISNSFDG